MINFLAFYHKLLFLLCLFLFAFIPLYPKFPLLNIGGTFIAIRFEDMLIAILVILWAIFMVLSNQIRVFLKDRLTQILLLFFFVGAVSLFSAIFLTHSVSPSLGFLHLFRRVEYMILLPIIATVVKTRKEFVLILVILSFTLLAINFYALGQHYLDWPVISTTNSEFSKGQLLRLTPGARVNSTFAGHYDLAAYLAMALSLMTAIFFAVNKRLKLGILLLSIFSLLILVMTAARLSFFAAFVGIISALVLSKRKKYLLLIFLVLVVVLIYPSQLRDRFISTLTINVLHLGQRYESQTEDQQIRSKLNIPTLAIKTSSESAESATFASNSGTVATDITPGEPLDSTQLGVYRSFQIRLNIEWPRALRAFIKNPLLGTGYSSIDIATDNDILRSLGEVGLLGTLALILIFVEIGKRIYCCFTKEVKLIKYFSVGVIAIMVTFLINSLFIDVLEASKVASMFWMVTGLSLAALKFK